MTAHRHHRAKADMRKWLDTRYASIGGFTRWEEAEAEQMRPEQEAVLFGVTVATVYEWRKWYRETIGQ